MSNPTTTEDFPDLPSHQRMWNGFTHLLVRSIIGIVILVLFFGFVTGTL